MGWCVNVLILAVLICICIALYAIWHTQMEILKVLRRINVKALNAALFLRDDPAPDEKLVTRDSGKAN